MAEAPEVVSEQPVSSSPLDGAVLEERGGGGVVVTDLDVASAALQGLSLARPPPPPCRRTASAHDVATDVGAASEVMGLHTDAEECDEGATVDLAWALGGGLGGTALLLFAAAAVGRCYFKRRQRPMIRLVESEAQTVAPSRLTPAQRRNLGLNMRGVSVAARAARSLTRTREQKPPQEVAIPGSSLASTEELTV